MIQKSTFALALGMLFLIATSTSHALDFQKDSRAANWCEEARKSLSDKNGNEVSCHAVEKRCIKMNNYWCQKHGKSPWRGTADRNGNDGNQDIDGHAIFENAKWSARAIALDLRAKHRRGITTALKLAENYSPWCDTLGSKAVVSGSGRTCKDGRAVPPQSFKGPFCKAPSQDAAVGASCLTGCNCPPKIAQTLVGGLDLGIDVDMGLFDAEGRPTKNLVTVLRNLAYQEQGVHVREEIIEAGLKMLEP